MGDLQLRSFANSERTNTNCCRYLVSVIARDGLCISGMKASCIPATEIDEAFGSPMRDMLVQLRVLFVAALCQYPVQNRPVVR